MYFHLFSMIKTAIQQKTISSLLREKRRERNLTIEQIADATKIRSEYLIALENSLYNKFPSEVYIKGFLKNYAKYLGIPTDQALALYRRENIVKIKPKHNLFLEKIKERSQKIVITPNKIILAITIVVIIAILLYLSSYFGKVLKKPSITLTSPINVTEEGEYSYNTVSNTFDIVGEIDVNAKMSINGQDLSPATMTTFSKTIELKEEISKYIIKATTPFGRESVVTIAVNYSNNLIDNSNNNNVQEIRASVEVLNNNINLTVYVDGALRLDKVYDKGTVVEFTALDSIIFTTNKDSVLTVNINGIQEKMVGRTVTYELNNGKILKN